MANKILWHLAALLGMLEFIPSLLQVALNKSQSISCCLVKESLREKHASPEQHYGHNTISNCPRIHCRQIALMEGGGWVGEGAIQYRP